MSRALLGVAHKTLPCGTLVDLYNNGRTVTVPVIDRGPFRPGTSYDLTAATARAIGVQATTTIGAVRSVPAPVVVAGGCGGGRGARGASSRLVPSGVQLGRWSWRATPRRLAMASAQRSRGCATWSVGTEGEKPDWQRNRALVSAGPRGSAGAAIREPNRLTAGPEPRSGSS